jgi:hypothetical protein
MEGVWSGSACINGSAGFHIVASLCLLHVHANNEDSVKTMETCDELPISL